MKKRIIGIPRTAYYYKEGVFWKHFFLKLGCKIILSSETNNKIKENGQNNLTSDNCFQNKLLFGHIKMLSKSCDYILIYSNCSYYNNCINYKILKNNLYNHLISSQILEYNNHKNKYLEIIRIASKITKNPIRIIYSYIYAQKKQNNYNINLENYEKNKLNNQNNKVLLIGNYNNIEDKYISNTIIDRFIKNNVTPLFSNKLSKKEAIFFSNNYKNKINSIEIKRLLGSIFYYEYSIKGIIYISNTNCKLDNYIFDVIKNEFKKIPIIDIKTNNDPNKETKLELFIDTIKNNNK